MSGELTERETGLMLDVFRRREDISRVVLFGSRAKGSAKDNSDIDLAVSGVSDIMAEDLALELEELPLPYKFDVLACDSISHKPLLEHIHRAGKVIYEKPSKQRPDKLSPLREA
jgi:predicted nucleotidyltransferase